MLSNSPTPDKGSSGDSALPESRTRMVFVQPLFCDRPSSDRRSEAARLKPHKQDVVRLLRFRPRWCLCQD